MDVFLTVCVCYWIIARNPKLENLSGWSEILIATLYIISTVFTVHVIYTTGYDIIYKAIQATT